MEILEDNELLKVDLLERRDDIVGVLVTLPPGTPPLRS
jgi:hypothetical protein